MTDAGAPATIVVRTKIFPLAFLLLLFKTTVTIDGSPNELPWGEHSFPVQPGSHSVAISFKYLFGDMGRAAVNVELAPGAVVQVHYRSPWLVFMAGKVSVVR
jgi:hypothetical protein